MPYVKKEIKKGNHSFKPIELSEITVNAIYNRCSASEEEIKEKKDLVLAQTFMEKYAGQDSRLSVFSSKKLKDNKKSIDYLLGQVYCSDSSMINYQLGFAMFSFSESFYNYSHNVWTDEEYILTRLFDLGIAQKILDPFTRFDATTCFSKIHKVIPKTLSPKDPNFPAWWAEHKSEWEEPKKEGNEPSID